MGELWTNLTESLRHRPLLWLPVLVAEFVAFWLKIGVSAILRTVLLNASHYQSALGGSIQGPLNQAAVHRATLVAIPLGWAMNLLTLLLYATALVVTAALVCRLLDSCSVLPRSIPGALRSRWGGILELALRALTVFVVVALLVGWLARWLGAHGHALIIQSPLFAATWTFLVMLLLAFLLASPALRVLSGRAPEPLAVERARILGYILVTVAALVTFFVGSNSAALMNIPEGARVLLGMVAALVGALPYALLYVGYGLLAAREEASAL